MEAPEEFQDELASLSLNNEHEKKPLHRNPKFFVPAGIVFIILIIIIAATSSGGSDNNNSSLSILPGLSNGGNSDSVPVSPTASPKTIPPTMPPTRPQTMPPTTNPPTASPVIYNPLSTAECQAIALGQNLAGQDILIRKSFEVPIDVVLTDDSKFVDETAIAQQLQNKIQTKIMPNIAGCGIRRRLRKGSSEIEMEYQHRLLEGAAPYVVANAQSHALPQLTGCKMSNALNCLSVVVTINLYLKGDESENALMRLISDTFAPPEGIVNKLQLSQPIVGLWISTVEIAVPFVSPPSAAPQPPPPSVQIEGIEYWEDDDEFDDDADDDDDDIISSLIDDDDDDNGDDDGDDDDDDGDDDDDDDAAS